MNNQPMFARIRKSKTVQLIMAFAALNLLIEMAFPTVAMALTSGASSPEFASFEPVATTDMVNDFTGDFTYNLPVLSVPGPDGGGYSMSLSYHSGVSSEEEASWVGFGWTLNPGAINRQKRGIPDDFDGVTVTKYNKTKPNWTQAATFDFNMEYTSQDPKTESDEDNPLSETPKQKFTEKIQSAFSNFSFGNPPAGPPADASFSLSKSIRYNNYSGFNIVNGFGIGTKGMASLNMNRSAGETTLGFSVNPIALLRAAQAKYSKIRHNVVKEKFKAGKKKLHDLYKANMKSKKERKNYRKLQSMYSGWSFNAPAVPYSVSKSVGMAYNYSGSFQVNPAGPIGFQAGIRGSMNYQVPESSVDHQAYGYMYNPEESMYTETILADYQIEKPTTFNKHDRNLGIPFNNADLFAATGNGVVGGFQFHHDQIGHYYAPYVVNEQSIRQAGVEFGVGGTIQVGFDFGIGFQKTAVDDWRSIENSDYQFDQSSEPYLRFNGDMGGEVRYSHDDQPMTATVGGAYLNRKLNLDAFNTNSSIEPTKKGRSSNIEYITTTKGIIEGISVVNKDGNRSVYGEPVYVHEETELTVGINQDFYDGQTTTEPYIKHGTAINYTNPISMSTTVIGQKVSARKYASTYLLTENTTFDYIDADADGELSEGDFGGWTKFEYRHPHTNYRYRAPYTGLIYNRGRLFDGDDQTGSMTSGTKDVKYLKSIETKTHIAFFVTNKTQNSDFPDYPSLNLMGSGTDRPDGIDADASASSASSKGGNYLEKLEQIVLYAKNDLSKPISTTYFEYNNTLVQGIPNTDPTGNEGGKLTLKRVWTESGGTVKSKIAPYQFEYEYFTDYSTEITTKYPDLLDGYSQLTKGNLTSSISDQNPLYKEGQLDMWGMYRTDGEERFQDMKPWVNQKDDDPHFDPAAWQLKRIILPSGGEIHIQYEQKDYRYVQDKEAMVMTSLLDHASFNNSYDALNNRYYINLEDLGISPSDPNYADILAAYRQKLDTYFVTGLNKLYFKILYSLEGSHFPRLDQFNHRFDYITGYTSVNEVAIDGNQIYLQLGKTDDIQPTLEALDKTMPRWVGFRKLHEQADMALGWNAHNMRADDNTIFAMAYDASGNEVTGSPLRQIGKQFTKANTFNLFGNWVSGQIKNVDREDACESLNPSLSYFKLPIFHDKKGGGIRVKRLLSYDPGISGETGDAMVYGSEYIYKNEDGYSSGVATNEPQQGREESPLVTIVERNKQSGWDKLLNGQDSKTHEGPLGESLLPGASVVHERVVIKNIHSGATTTGYAVNRYHTTKTFPMQVDYTEISKEGDTPTYKKFNLNLPLGLFNMNVNRAWVTQGYLFKLNDMHGKPMSQATYAGEYNQSSFYEAAATSKTAYTYSRPGTPIKSLIYNPDVDVFEEGTIRPGEEEDLTLYRSKVTDRTNDFSLELDLNITLPTAVSLGFGLSYDYQENQLSQHVTSKILRQKSYLLATTTTTDGVTQTTENLAFDRYTGDPVLTRTYDGYKAVDEVIITEGDGGAAHDGHYYALNIPASWIYKEMSPKDGDYTNSTADDDYFNQLTASAGNVVTYGGNELYAAINPDGEQTWSPINDQLTNVVNASSTVYKNGWFNGNDNQLALEAEYSDLSDPTINGLSNQHYYPLRTYVYRDEVTDANDPNTITRIYGGGLITNPFDFFNWKDELNTNNYDNNEIGKWYSASKIVSYSPHGYPVEEKDVLDINSTARFGYNSTLPVLVSQNAQYKEVQFIDFEYGAVTGSTSIAAHSGQSSFNYAANQNHEFVSDYPISPEMIMDNEKGVSIKLWLKSSLSTSVGSPNYGLKNSSPQLKAQIGVEQFSFQKIAQTGDWSLYVANIKNFNSLSANDYDIQLSYNYQLGEQVLIDDFRIQPIDAVMNCTVYTKDNKVAAQFDDQHFGVFYEYNNKGQLVRKSIETERGKKTLQEQQYNTPLTNRSN